MKTPTRIALLAAAACLPMLGGCASDPQDVSYAAITNTLSPELVGMNQRAVDRHTAIMTAAHVRTRQLSDDILHVLYLHHPSTLSPYPIMSLNGQPR